ncbi:hypothetical protein LWI29_028517 [Acer saccharum]|uniref:Uncharacterized protein n=1 Tax=Acer saccharum TaxID=4024 RepID=A0AA39VBV7_ACESA|nr:hypothetical protein LWI29_028517 [Acer saccharum]
MEMPQITTEVSPHVISTLPVRARNHGEDGHHSGRDYGEAYHQYDVGRYDGNPLEYAQENHYKDDRKSPRSVLTDDDLPPRRHRATRSLIRFNKQSAQVAGHIPSDPYGITICQRFDKHWELEGERQRKNEKLKDYLIRFSQEVSEVQDPNDYAVVSTFINSLQHSQLSLSLRQNGLTTDAHLVDDMGGYAMAEEEQIAHGGEFIHGG